MGVVEWYNGKSVFITGATGFMGKVLVEKLLSACPGIQKIYILIRPKRGKSPEKRIEAMWDLPVFKSLREAQPDAIKKVIPLNGDLSGANLQLKESDLNLIIDNVNVIFHIAATLKLEATLKDALEQNTSGTIRVIDVAKKVKNLSAFIHYSTAFCSADLDVFEEKFYDCREDPREVIEISNWMPNDALEIATPKIIYPHPNTYTYTKRLAEKVVAQEFGNLPVCIIRPSIVTPAALHPLPGWVDSLNGPMGLLVGAGKGVIRSMHVTAGNRAHVVPVDVAINATIVVAQKIATNPKPKEIPIYNITNDEVIRVTYGEVLNRGRSVVYDNPFEGQIWYPDGDIRSSRLVHQIYCLVWHWFPAYLIDFLMILFFQKRFMVRLQTKIHDGLELLQFFTTREWIFKSQNFLNLQKDLSEKENELFPMDYSIMSIDEYLRISVLGARQYLMKEDLSTIPRCRVQQNILMVIHKTLVFMFYFFTLYWILSHFQQAKFALDFVGYYAKHVPLFGRLIPASN